MRCGVYVVRLKSESHSAIVITVPYVILWWIKPRYNGISTRRVEVFIFNVYTMLFCIWQIWPCKENSCLQIVQTNACKTFSKFNMIHENAKFCMLGNKIFFDMWIPAVVYYEYITITSINMMTSWHWNTFCITGPLRGNSLVSGRGVTIEYGHDMISILIQVSRYDLYLGTYNICYFLIIWNILTAT